MNAPLPAALQTPHTVEAIRARPLLGTLVEIAASGRDTQQVNAAIDRAFSRVKTVHTLMSYHDADSDVSRINRFAHERPIPVNEDTWHVLATARDLAETSGGLFDISVAPTLAKLGYLPRHAGFPKPSGQGDWRHVVLFPGNMVRLTRRLHLDLGGIAKGYAVDLALRALQDAGMRAGRVNAGGDLALFCESVQTIHVRHPLHATLTLPLIQMQRGAVATSASYFSAKRQRGRWVTPLINPATRTPCETRRSVSVLADDCLIADALTKVVHADPLRALGVLAHYRARAVMLEHDPITGGCRMMHSDTGRWQVQLLPDAGHG